MRNLPVAFLILLFLTGSFPGQSQTKSGEEELAALNKKLLLSYKDGKYDDALKTGQEALNLSSKLYGEESLQTAAALFNLGAVYRSKKNYPQAMDNFQRSLAVYQKNYPEESAKILAVYNEMGRILSDRKEFSEAEDWFLKALELSDKVNSNSGKDSVAYAASLGLIYRAMNAWEKAEAYLWRAKRESRKVYGFGSPEHEENSDNYACYTAVEEYDHLRKIVEKRQAEERAAEPSREIINGRARELVKPRFPRGAGEGKVLVRIQINEAGDVTTAKAFCGPDILRPSSELAARKSKFFPTLLKGLPVKVSGIVVYNFQRK